MFFSGYPCSAYSDDGSNGNSASRVDVPSFDYCVVKNGQPDSAAGGTYTDPAPLGRMAQQKAAAGR